MNSQNEITKKTRLLDKDGQLLNPGYCKRNLYEYNREDISPSIMRLKEWDFYQISDGKVMAQLNFFNISLASCVTFAMVDLKTGKSIDSMSVELFTPYKNRMNKNGDTPNFFEYSFGSTRVKYDVKEAVRHLYFQGKSKGKKIKADFTCFKLPEHESITTATPLNKKGHFFYTQKLNCLNTFGTISIDDKVAYEFKKDETFTVLDWGRGVWTYSNMWYWANGSTILNGKSFGFELTWGFGNESSATETAIFYDGKCHKIGAVNIEKDPEIGDKWLDEWHFTSEDGRLDLTMKPFYDYYTKTALPFFVFGIKSHQLHGLWSGNVVLDDGTKLEIKDMYAFCEKVYNNW